MLQPFSSTMLNQDELETIESLLSASRSKVAKATLHKIQNPESFELARAFQQYNDSYCVIPYNDKKAKLPSTQFIAGVMYNWGKRNAGQSMKTCIAAVPFFVEMWKKQHAEWLSYYK